jgi:hypothetical protein
LPAVYGHFRKIIGSSTTDIEELVVYRTTKELGPIFHVVMLKTAPEHYGSDHLLFLEIREGLHFMAIPKGEYSNN